MLNTAAQVVSCLTVSGVWCSRQEGITFSEEEENKAVEILDTSGDGLIQFEEFVSWWTTKVSKAATARLARAFMPVCTTIMFLVQRLVTHVRCFVQVDPSKVQAKS